MKISQVLEQEESDKQAALRYQQELLQLFDGDVNIVRPPAGLIKKAVVENGVTRLLSSAVSLQLLDGVNRVELLLMKLPSGKGDWALYHVYTDYYTPSAVTMYDHAKAWIKFGSLKEDSSVTSSSTKLHRFARELVAKGFNAEVTNKAPTGVVNSSKLGIKVKGYGIDDFIKLYRPLWRWEDTGTRFADCKTEKRFSTVQELVDKLKDRYPKLSKCMSFKAPLKEAVAVTPGLKQRVMKFHQDLIEALPNDATVSVPTPFEVKQRHGLDPFMRFVIIIEFSEIVVIDGKSLRDLAIVINDIAEVGEDPLVDILVIVKDNRGDKTPLDEVIDFSDSSLSNHTNTSVFASHDETQNGQQEGFQAILDVLKSYSSLK